MKLAGTVHGSVHAGAAAARALSQSKRQGSAISARIARHRRDGRPQPLWPRLCGLGCIGVALIAALRSFDPMPTHVAVSSSARPVPKVEAPAAPVPRLVRPLGRQAHPVDRFEWQPAAGVTRHTLVVLDAGYEELARHAAGAASEWPCDADLAARLARGGTFHWFVLAEQPGQPACAVKSPIESFATP